MIETQQHDTLRLFYNEKYFQYDTLSIDSIYIKKADSIKVKNFNLDNNPKNLLLDKKTVSYRESLFTKHNIKKKSSETPISNTSIDSFFAIYIGIALILAWLFFNYKRNIKQIFNAALNNQKMQHLVREQNLFKERISIFLTLAFIISYSIFIVQAYSFFFIQSKIDSLFLISLKLSIVIAVFILLKWLVMHFVGVVFKNEEAASLYILNSLIYNVITSILLIPLTFILFYINFELRVYFLYIGLIMLLIINTLRYFRYVIIGLTYSKFSFFYLILYLCTLEILPVLLVLKMFLKLIVNNIEFL